MKQTSSEIVHYEIYVLDKGRWVLHARHRHSERDAALEEAKALDRQPFVEGVKLIRDGYDPKIGGSDETVLFMSQKKPKSHQSGPRQVKDGRFKGKREEAFHPSAIPANKIGEIYVAPTHSKSRLLWRMLVGLGTSVGVAVGITLTVGLLISFLERSGIFISHQVRSNVLFAVFMLSFVLGALPLLFLFASTYSGNQERAEEERRQRRYSNAKMFTPTQSAYKIIPSPKPLPLPLEGEDATMPLPDSIEEEGLLRLRDEEEVLDYIEGRERPDWDDPSLEAEGPPDIPDQDLAVAGSKLEPYLLSLTRFMSGAVGILQKIRPRIDAFNKFGLDLTLAGACEHLGEKYLLAANDKELILREIMERSGSRPDLARSFCDKYESYLREPRYLGMIEAGKTSMQRFLGQHPSPFSELAPAFEAWNKPHTPTVSNQPPVIAVMFTDIVGSTDLTQNFGDLGAQDILRTHNQIVRTTLSQYNGIEVKHTGDGIMASFSSPANAAEAATTMLRAMKEHNIRTPSLPLHMRIGINAGEPIVEEHDLFGTTVQLAARLCNHAGTDQALCSNVVRELSAGKNIVFTHKGQASLKGFKEPVQIYEVQG